MKKELTPEEIEAIKREGLYKVSASVVTRISLSEG